MKKLAEGIQNPKSKIQNSLPWWLVIPAGGGVAAIATGAFWLGRRSKPSSESFAYETVTVLNLQMVQLSCQ